MYLYFHLEFKICCILFIYFQNKNSSIFFLNTATIAFNFICKNKRYLKKNSLQRASIYRCWWLYLYEIMTLYNGLRQYLINWYFNDTKTENYLKLYNKYIRLLWVVSPLDLQSHRVSKTSFYFMYIIYIYIYIYV